MAKVSEAMCERVRHEHSLTILASSTNPDIIKQSWYTDREI